MKLTKTLKNRVFYGVVGLLVAVPIVTLGLALIRHSVNVFWWDQLPFVELIYKFDKGTLTFYDLWQQHNEHRIVVPQAFELIIGKITGFNVRVYILMNFLAVLASFALMMTLLKKTFANNKTVICLAVPFAWLLFSPIQYVNWVWGFQLAFFMTTFFTILTIWLLVRDNVLASSKIFILALIAATLTTYCNGNGMLIWPIGLAILFWRRAERARLIQWAAVGSVIIGSYLYKFHRSPDSPHLSTVIKEPVAVMKYTFGYLGRNLAVTPTQSRYVGFALLCILAISIFLIYKKRQLDNIVAWLAIAGYVLITAVFAAVSRLNFGVNHSFISNSYPTISVLFILATIAITAYAAQLWVKDLNKKNAKRYLLTFFILGGFCFYVLTPFITNYNKGSENIEAFGAHLHKVQLCTYNAQSPDDECLALLYPHTDEAWTHLQTLRALRWGDFKNEN